MRQETSEPVSELLRDQPSAGTLALVLNRPDRRNALTPQLAQELADQIVDLGNDPNLKTIFMRGAGGHFCVGLDLKWVQANHTALTPSTTQRALAAFQDVVRAIAECPLPVVAVLEGSVAGIGLDIAAACDIRVAAKTLSMHSAFAKIGLVPDGGSTYRLARIVGESNALFILMSGIPIDAPRAREMGFVTAVFPPEETEREILAWAQRMTAQSRNSLIRIKQLVREGELDALNARMKLEGEAQLEALASEEFAARLRAFTSG